ncbi:hypothetical protein GE115_12120 [Agromyces sp. CFH 90414]|uniref:SAF domain-containing protein n=1 Tax=Agromyces agglutinans TaxID=2662258 RepID=A0A6I2FA01_9MICO|nr:hypothetical protein [Agromyces agglutinans]MRG60607.1 hypothetical protein [Agromyces agglutinans]
MAREDRRDRGAVRFDPRLAIGLVLIAGSTVGVWALVTGLDTATEVYVVQETVPTGARIEASDLAIASVRLGDAADRYLVAGDLPDDGVVAARTIGAGELVPLAAIAHRADDDSAVVVVPLRAPLPSGVGAGARVDLWSAKPIERGGYEPPAVLVSDAEIRGVIEADGVVADGGVSVELLVPREKVAGVLQALAAGGALDLVGARTERTD